MIKPNTITAQPGHVVDISPTLLDLLNISYPDSIHGYPSLPLHGKSLLPVFEGKEREDPEYFISGLDRFRMFREGAYKIVRMNDGDWELYDMIKDPTELENLAGTLPDKVNELSGHYDRISKQWEQVPDVP